ncbi:MAG: TonB family protein [Bacteroidota bacterium]
MKNLPWDDLVFTNRNRSYGAYVLRKEYPTALVASFVFMLVVMALMFALAPVFFKLFKAITISDKVVKKLILTIEPPKDDLTKNRKPEPHTTRTVRHTTRQSPAVIPTQAVNQALPAEEIQNNSTAITGTESAPVETISATPPPIVEVNDPNKVWSTVEQSPSFPGGVTELMKYVGKNTRYPAEARRQNVQGSVFISFVVDTDGTIDNVEVIRSIGAGCDKEAMRVVSGMPKWKPGKQHGVDVKVRFVLPIKFRLENM